MLLLCCYFSLYHCIWLYENKDIIIFLITGICEYKIVDDVFVYLCVYIVGMSLDRVPSGFSDATTIDDVDLTNMTEEEKTEYFKQKETRRKEREIRRRAKYGDKYDDIMKKRDEYVYV